MMPARAGNHSRIRILILLTVSLALPSRLLAQGGSSPVQGTQASPAAAPQTQAPTPAAPPTQAPVPDQPAKPPEALKPHVHRFWDQTNCLLFAGVLGARYLDFASTLNARRRGLDEALLNNETVDNHGEFAVIEFAGAATSVGVSYLFHRYGHHSLERWTSIVHISVTTFGAGRNFLLKTPHPPTVAPGP